jgi:hypothetical protein
VNQETGVNKRLSSKIEIEYPGFTKLPERVRQKFDSLPTKVNFSACWGIARVHLWKLSI